MKSILVFMLLLLFNSYNIFAFPSKAVLLLGGKLGASKTQFEKELLQCKEILEENAVSVTLFTTATCSWKEIANEASEADLLIYSGHGVNISGNYGGFLLANGQVISPEQIRRDLHFKKNTLVYFLHTCGSAGSSALDRYSLTETQAQNRVMNYASPFIQNGASAVLAINWNDQVFSILNDMLIPYRVDTSTNEEGEMFIHQHGSTIGESYVKVCNELNQSIIINLPYPGKDEMSLYVSHNDPTIRRDYLYVTNEKGEVEEVYTERPTGKKGPITYELSFVGDSNFRW
jgi:hypothetical protein